MNEELKAIAERLRARAKAYDDAASKLREEGPIGPYLSRRHDHLCAVSAALYEFEAAILGSHDVVHLG